MQKKNIANSIRVERAVHENKIQHVKGRIGKILSLLRKDKTILQFDLSTDHYNNRFQLYTLAYKCSLPYLSTHSVYFYFKINFQNKSATIIEKKQSATYCNVEMSSFFDENVLRRIITSRISQWVKGAKNEDLFYEKILKPLLTRSTKKRILQVYRVGERKDKLKGIDFSVHFLKTPDYSTEKVSFNLKSSDKFLEKHQQRYPNISTFIFAPWHLREVEKTTRRFLRFMSTAQNEVCHH